MLQYNSKTRDVVKREEGLLMRWERLDPLPLLLVRVRAE